MNVVVGSQAKISKKPYTAVLFLIFLTQMLFISPSFSAPQTVLLPIQREGGWNFFSSPGIPLTTDLNTFFQGQLEGAARKLRSTIPLI